ncbi:cell surface receptor IPT/TIG domain protein [Paludibacter propionicigenes WB4]|uniref:Cell surface receptor IPT/TIG domain protein n=1 Tax=Paludibacter propionicigenes (strain DSM 17365 / JCM 13257 / WB4) TaxID=694427 RepID=E4T8J6_PALPW|nr:MBG domain-containing protein [Paludibacter propionicigenes]ADQ81040.1 cell surface receptor IPT/TIG domain protein [Paludibacter propionicigenes WB4]
MRKTFTLLFIFLITLQVAVKAQDRIYWGITSQNISSAKLDGTDVKRSVTLSGQIFDMETDFYKGILYYGDGSIVKKTNTDGTNLQKLYEGSKTIGGLALDLINNKLYFSEYGSGNVIIRRCNLDGTGMEVIVTSPNSNFYTYNLTISTTLQKLYWTESKSSTANSIILRCNLDGTNVETLMTTTSFIPGLTIDEKSQRLYLAYWSESKVMTTDMTCSTTPTLVFANSNKTFQMAVSNVDEKLYFAEMGTKKIRKCNLDGSSPQDIVSGLSGQPMALSIPTVPPAPTINANETYTFELNDFIFSSVDKNLLAKIKITTLTSKGTLYLDANNNNIVDAGEAVVLNQEIAKADLVAGTLKFNPAANEYGSPYTTFTFIWFNGTSYTTLDLLQYIYVLSIAPTVTTQAVSDIGSTTATGNGNITDLGVPFPTSYGVCWNTTGTPTTSDSKVDKGSISTTGAFTAAITGLTANTTYKVRAYATNEVGTSYGTEVSFTTAASPTVTAISPSSGSTVGGTTVTITGTNLIGVTAVKFGSTNATSFSVNSTTQITAVSPSGTAGAVDITVTTQSGTSTISINDKFTYFGAPTFTSTPVTTVNYNQDYNYNANTTIEGGIEATITAPTLPAWLSINGQQGNGTPKLIGNIPAGVLITGAAEDNNGNIYAITYYDDDNTTLNTIYKITPDGTTTVWKSGLISGAVYELHIANGYIYIPRYMSTVNSITRVPLNNPDAVEENFASLTHGALALTDHGGWIYASDYSSREIVRVNETTKASEIILTSANGIPSSGVFGLDFDQNENLFIATYQNRSILKYNTSTSTLSTVLSGLPTDPTSIKVDKQGNYYVALESGGLRKYKPDFSSYESVSLNANDDVWGLSMSKTGAITYSQLGSNNIYSIKNGLILQGTPAKSDVGSHNVVLRATNDAGYTDQTFTINVVDNVAPVVTAYSPVTNSTDISLQPTLSLTFDEEVSLGSTGILSIYNGASLVKSYDLSMTADRALFTLSADKKTVSVTLTENLPVNTLLNVGLSAGFVKDKYDNNFAGFTAASNTWQFTTINKVAQTITYPAIDTKTYGDADFILGNATTDKGLTITFTAADPTVVSITGNQATILKAGNTKITATQTGDNVTFAATQVEQILSVKRALLTVKADNKSKVYDGQVADNFTVAYTGFVKDETATALIGTLSFTGTAVTAITAGLDYIITPSGYSSDNYTITYENGKLDISKRPITITADAKSKTYGDADPALTAQISSGTIVTGDVASGSLVRTTGETAADYAIDLGTYTYGSNYTETFVPANLTIGKRAITLTAVADTKTYDGTTVSTAIPTVGTLATGDAINVAPTQTFDNAAVGTTHVLTASGLTIKNGNTDVTSNYDISYVPANGNITAKALTMSDPTVTLSKVYDGNTVAAVTAGTLSGVVTTDEGNVTVTAVGNYDNATIGTNKMITVVYTLGGSAAGNYSAPANYLGTGAEILSGNITLEPLSNPTPNPDPNSTGLILSYNVVAGGPTQYQITFEASALAVGIQNVSYTALVTTGTDGSISITVPKGTKPGKYKGTLHMRNDFGVESPAYDFVLTVNIPTEYIAVKYNRVLVLDNSTRIFSAYQWFKDGVAIEGATKQFYRDPKGLVGTYTVQATDINGEILYSYPKVLNIPLALKVTAYPTMVRPSQTCTVEITDEAMELDMAGAELSVYSAKGIRVYHSTKVENLNTIKLPTMDGVYSGCLTTADGQSFSFKVIVTN